MHYKNGTPAKAGDIVVGRDCQGNVFSGVVIKTNPQSDACNLVVQPIIMGQQIWMTAKECLLADDALTITTAPTMPTA